MTWCKNGRVTVQSGSRSVFGVGTAWLTQVMPGEGLDILDGRLQEIAEVISNTELLLVDAYAGAGAADSSYQIIPSASMTKELTRRVNALLATHEKMTADVGQAYASTLENAERVSEAAIQVGEGERAAAESARSASESRRLALADSDSAMGYRNESRAAGNEAKSDAAVAVQARADAVAARDSASAYAQSIDPVALRDRSTHTGVQSVATIEGLSGALEKLKGVAEGATKNVPDSDLLDREKHTGPLNWGWCTYGGTANAISLAAVYKREALLRGDVLRFRATATNTGAATIKLDGLSVVAAVTVTGASLPAGYIRTDVDTEAVYDGVCWVVDRAQERGVNSNGWFVREASGVMRCGSAVSGSATTAVQVGAGFQSADVVVFNYPALFTSRPNVAISTVYASGQSQGWGIMNRYLPNGFDCIAISFHSGVKIDISFIAEGKWY